MSFDLKQFLVENKLTTNSRILNENFYAPDYIKQKYGNKAKEIEQNIHDAEESENNPNLWDHFTSLETSKEVEDFIQGFINENVETVKILEILTNYSPDWMSFEEFENQQGQGEYSGDEDDYNPSEGEWPVIGDEYDSFEEMEEALIKYNEEVGRDSEIVAIKTTVGRFRF